MSLILSVESATMPGSVALHKNGSTICIIEMHRERSHASKLPIMLEQIIKFIDIDFSDLNAIAISSGPGSYTGLRIGAGIAKGLAYAIKIPLISVDTLKIIASGVRSVPTETLIAPMIDARRSEVYTCLLNSNLDFVEETKPLILNKNSFQERLAHHKIIFCGDGSVKAKEIIVHKNAIFAKNVYPSAMNMGELAHNSFENSDFCDINNWEPDYLKAFRAGKPRPLTVK